jgi:polar amino acid transport system permease protein
MLPYDWHFEIVFENIPFLLKGLSTTVSLAGASMSLGLLLGLIVALARLSRFKILNSLAYFYTEIFRTTPLLIQIIWMFYAIPILFGLKLTAFQTGVLAFTLNLGAFLAEVYRGGILSIDRGQSEAALSTGMTYLQCMRRIILPQAIRRMVPPIASIWISLFKDTSLVIVIGITELMFQTRALAIQTFRPMEVYTIAALVYFVITYPQSLLVNLLFEKFRVIE